MDLQLPFHIPDLFKGLQFDISHCQSKSWSEHYLGIFSRVAVYLTQRMERRTAFARYSLSCRRETAACVYMLHYSGLWLRFNSTHWCLCTGTPHLKSGKAPSACTSALGDIMVTTALGLDAHLLERRKTAKCKTLIQKNDPALLQSEEDVGHTVSCLQPE